MQTSFNINAAATPQSQYQQRVDRAQWRTELHGYPAGFIPLDQETRTHVSTKVMCHHLGRKEQTARGWACHEDGPLRPIHVNGRLAWAVADIRRILGVVSKVGA
jgi:hypothetical protein